MIDTAGVRKSYGSVQALDGLDLRVPRGAVCGVLGRNGAGKTTTIKVLLGMVRPTSGTARVFGLSATDERTSVEIRGRTAFVSEDKDLYAGMTVAELIRFTAPFYPKWRADLASGYLAQLGPLPAVDSRKRIDAPGVACSTSSRQSSPGTRPERRASEPMPSGQGRSHRRDRPDRRFVISCQRFDSRSRLPPGRTPPSVEPRPPTGARFIDKRRGQDDRPILPFTPIQPFTRTASTSAPGAVRSAGADTLRRETSTARSRSAVSSDPRRSRATRIATARPSPATASAIASTALPTVRPRRLRGITGGR